MNVQRQLSTIRGLAIAVTMSTTLSVAAMAQQAATVQGLVIGRDGPTMVVRTSDTPRLLVTLSDSTKATEKGGFLGMSRKDLGITQLVPGLQVKVEGTYDSDHKLVAKRIWFSRNSLNTANAIDAGLNPTNERVAAGEDRERSDRKDIEGAQSDLAQNKQDIATTKQGLDANVQATNANTAGIGKANQRFTTLDQYVTKDTVTVNFANGRSTVTKKYKDQLVDFVKQVADTPGAMIEVQGYASAVGSAALNQRLSSERADAVLTIIQQAGVPLTRILAPAAMGTTNPLGGKKSEDRRVVVTIVVNKGITGAAAGM